MKLVMGKEIDTNKRIACYTCKDCVYHDVMFCKSCPLSKDECEDVINADNRKIITLNDVLNI